MEACLLGREAGPHVTEIRDNSHATCGHNGCHDTGCGHTHASVPASDGATRYQPAPATLAPATPATATASAIPEGGASDSREEYAAACRLLARDDRLELVEEAREGGDPTVSSQPDVVLFRLTAARHLGLTHAALQHR